MTIVSFGFGAIAPDAIGAEVVTLPSTRFININLEQAKAFTLTLNQNAVIAAIQLPSGITHSIFYLQVTQDSFGGRSLVSGNSEITFTGGTINLASNSISIIKFITFNAGANWQGVVQGTINTTTPTQLWTPANIATSIWLDASDISTMSFNNTEIMQWNDKSGNSRHFSQHTSTNQPTYLTNNLNNKNVVVFEGSNDFIRRDSIDLGSNITLFFVCKFFTSNRTGLFDTSPNSGNVARNYSNDAVEWWANNPSLTLNAPINDWCILTIIYSLSGSRKIEKWVNDSNYNYATSNSNVEIAWNNLIIGTINYSLSPFQGSIAEIVIANFVADESIRQKLAGYAAHKWGLQDKLDANHPYKVSPP